MTSQLKRLESHSDLQIRNEFSSLEGLRLLVVDNDPDTRELLTVMFVGDGAEVIAVASAREALAALERLKPNILISDIKLPGEDGYTLIRKARNWQAKHGEQILAIALTGCARNEDRIRALLAGFDQHVSKPVDLNDFAAMVANLASRILRPSARLNPSKLKDCSFNAS
jgi:CheY-like chemotaxis protein